MVVLDNGSRPAKAVVKAAPFDALYARETRRGIPIARNEAVRHALAHGAELIAFIDDDEIASKDWLAELVGEYRRTCSHLIGGPLVPSAPSGPLSLLEKLIFRGVATRQIAKNRKSVQRKARGRTDRITIVTNNWLAHRSIFDAGIWFDESSPLSSGSDADFSRRVKQAGFKFGWAENAVVYETVTPDRLTFKYQLKRAYHQGHSSFRRKLRDKRNYSVLATPAIVLARVLHSALCLAALPFVPSLALINLARSLGYSAGIASAALGRDANLYATVTGSDPRARRAVAAVGDFSRM